MASKLAVVKAAVAQQKLKIRGAAGKVSADEPADSLQAPANKTPQGDSVRPKTTQVQGGDYNPGNAPGQTSRTPAPQQATDSVNAKMQPAVRFKKVVRKS